jgi:hypothetical protein
MSINTSLQVPSGNTGHGKSRYMKIYSVPLIVEKSVKKLL